MSTYTAVMTAQVRDRVHIGETATGTWIVRDDKDRRGGRFRDRKTAIRFVRREFGANAQVVERPPLVTPNARRLTSADQHRLSRSAQQTG